jgi:YegS/Rv2252/BmrU family lipid kinase
LADRDQPGPHRRRILVVFNPIAGGRRAQARRYNAVLARLRAGGAELTIRETQFRGDAEAFAATIEDGRYDRLVVAGGDGTVNEVVNGLAANPGPAKLLPLALIPLGTANVLALEIGLALGSEGIARTILVGAQRPVALGQANGRRFLLMAGAGFDAHVVAGVDRRAKHWLGKVAYALSTLVQFRRYRFPIFRITVDGETFEGASAVVANARCYGGRFVLSPEADLEAPRLDLCLFTRSGRFAAMGYAAAMLFGVLPHLKSVRHLQGRRVLIEGPLEDPVQGDGDIIAALPAEIVVLPDALNLVFPA